MTLLQKIQRGAVVGLALTALVGLGLPGAKAQVSVSPGVTVSQGFSIGTAQTANLPSGWRVDKSTSAQTVRTYSGAGTATEQVGGNNLSSTAPNGIYNCGAGVATSATDRAVGFLSSTSATKSGNLYVWLQNSGGDITSLTISYDVEKYRQGLNPTGFSFQMYYSTDGNNWTSAGSDFLTSFSADATNNGYSSAPGVTVNVIDKTLSVSIPSGGDLYLAWNYSVTSGTTTSNAQCLAIDNVSIEATGTAGPTPPTGTGTANPASVDLGTPTTLSVTVTPGTNPASTGITVTGDLSSIGGEAAQEFVAQGGNVYAWTIAPSITGAKSIPITIADEQIRSSSTSIALDVTPFTVAQARAQGTGNVKVRGLVSAIHVGNVYITDADGGAGLMVYKSGWATAGSPWTDVQVGDDVTLTGPLSTYNNELELNGATSLVINSTGNTLPEPVEISLPANQADEGRLVTLKDLKITTAPTAMGTYSSFTVADTTANGMTIFIHKNTTSGATAWPGVPANPIDLSTFKVGEFITVTGVLGDYTSGLQIKPRNGDDIEWLGKPLPVSDLADGAVKSSPVAFNGKVFCGNNAGIVRCINTSTGVNTWEYNVVDEGAGNVLGRPALKSVGGTNYVFFTTEDGFVFCLNAADGAFVWSVGPLMTGATGVDTTPAVVSSATAASLADVSVYVTMFKGDEGRVYRLAGVDGALAATSDDLITAASGGKLSSPSVNDAGVFVSVTGGDAAGYRLIPGEATLTVSTQVALGKNSEQPPYIYNYWDAAYPRVLIAANDGTLSAFNATNGEIAYQNADVSSGAALTFPVARRDGNVVYMAGSNGIVYQANVADGTAPAGGYSFYTGAAGTTIQGLAIDPAGIGGAATLVFGDSSGAYHKVPLADASGAKVVKAVQTAGSVFATTPTIDATGGMVLLGNDNATVYGFARD